ncbi:Helicase associated domain protein [Streptomyces collinus]|uniref:Helicase associated domain protein n=1 Tax=Streptomyces collinus TaxID=42684 RepID=UPI000998AB08
MSRTGCRCRSGALLKVSTPCDPAALAAFINLRVLSPEHAHWRRGMEAATFYHRHHGDLRVPFANHRVPAGDEQEAETEEWPSALAAFPLGRPWVADTRRFHALGDMDPDHIAQLDALGMVWSHHDTIWVEGLAAARGWAAAHGHLPTRGRASASMLTAPRLRGAPSAATQARFLTEAVRLARSRANLSLASWPADPKGAPSPLCLLRGQGASRHSTGAFTRRLRAESSPELAERDQAGRTGRT